MTKADWIVNKISDIPYVGAKVITANSLVVTRAMQGTITVGCAEADPVDEDEVKRISATVEDLDFIVVIPSSVAIKPSVWRYCNDSGIVLGRFSDLRDGLETMQPLAKLRNRELQYISNRIERTPVVQQVARISETALEITCEGGASLVGEFVHPYEITEDEVFRLIDQQPDMSFLVVTNPYARGISPDSVRVAEDAGVRLVLMNEFVSNLGAICQS
ncbi:hypothetical protein [Arthrobacter sp. L77]|uniref:hypothetical protein n=1 Tax=Arthrobacter sp. L77 TaxID=1496689 RepID=UPI0012E091E6|nr:hypothetical protein [Arthrobacter sp. L77]